jgi:hypothetical protein
MGFCWLPEGDPSGGLWRVLKTVLLGLDKPISTMLILEWDVWSERVMEELPQKFQMLMGYTRGRDVLV